MQRSVITVTEDVSLKEAGRLIFSFGVAGIPVVRGKKLVGVITDEIILSKIHPTLEDLIGDYVHAKNFDSMIKNVQGVLETSVGEAMNPHVMTISPDAPLMQAHSLMEVNKFNRLPVVNGKNELLGVISQGDIFRSIVGRSLSLQEEDGYDGWLSKYYDELYDWERRLKSEMPSLAKLFRKEKIASVLDMSSSTGEHVIALAKEGFQAVGLEGNGMMHAHAQKKKDRLPSLYRDRITFLKGSYKKNLKSLSGVGAAVFMGNALRHVMNEDGEILEDVVGVLNKENPILVFQLLNFEKIFKVNNGFRDFILFNPPYGVGPKDALLSFYTKDSSKEMFISRAIFSLIGRNWAFRGIRSSAVVPIDVKELISKLKKLGFSKFSFYGSSIYQPIFKYPFKPLESDWLNIIAKK